MKRYLDKHNDFGTIWSARTKHFDISLVLEHDDSFVWDGHDEPDEEGETIQDKLNKGDFVAFDSKVCVELNGAEIGAAYLGGSVYASGDTASFMQGGYFEDMLNEACNEARKWLANQPRLRTVQ